MRVPSDTVRLKFEVGGLSPEAERDEGSVAVEINTISNRILLGVEERIRNLKILSVKEDWAANVDPIRMDEAILYYDVRVAGGGGRDFGTMIILELRRSYDEILDEIPFSDMTYMNKDLKFNWCANVKQGGGYTLGYPLCVNDNFEGTPTMDQSMPTRTDIANQSDPNSDDGTGGLPGWTIALILLLCFFILGCIGYLAFKATQKRDSTAEEEGEKGHNTFYPERQEDSNNQAYWEDDNNDSQTGRSYRTGNDSSHAMSYSANRKTSTGARSKASMESIGQASYGSKKIARSTNRNVGRDPTMYSANTAGHPGRDPSMYINDMPGRDPSMYIPGARQGRDPSFFIDGNEDRLDPDSSRGVMMATRDGDVGLPRRHYAKEPPLNPEIDP